ncbi:hypothetical protein PWT90_03361 [Aphanocladium album]|nr:hypothetical protein PWT90_03361 [Aphanocladium album]
MTRKKRTSKSPQRGASSQMRDHYNMRLSRQRLEREGFHPAVTDQSVEQVVDAWRDMVKTQLDAPQRGLRMTRAFLLLREEPELDAPGDNLCALEELITTQSVGPRIIGHIFATGHMSAFNLALTSRRLWIILAASVNYYDFYAGRLQNMGPSGVLVSATPEYMLGEMLMTRVEDPYGFDTAAPFTGWHNDAIMREKDVMEGLYNARKALRAAQKSSKTRDASSALSNVLKTFDERLLATIASLKDGKKKSISMANQFKAFPAWRVFEPQMIFAGTRLELLPIILRACPNVTMLGVYNCPLIHLGDIIPILDLIHEINEKRKPMNAPLITAFDFYPSFHRSLDVRGGQSPIYGLTADSMDLDIVQRGVYAILLKAFLKARCLKMSLLFETGRALNAFLFRLPNPPLSMPMFFDGVHRYLESGASSIQQRQALFDLTKPIRFGLEPDLDDEAWYHEEMGQYLPFCGSCGYEMLYELFPAGTRRVDPHRRVCAGCSLQRMLDEEPHDMHHRKLALLQNLMPDWKPSDYNKDAPMNGHGLMSLMSSEQGDVGAPVMKDIGSGAGPFAGRQVTKLQRGNKCPADSLQNLPSLRDLLDGDSQALWGALFPDCHRADLYARARQRADAEARSLPEYQKTLKLPRDMYGEIWHRTRHAREVQSFDYNAAVSAHLLMDSKGW